MPLTIDDFYRAYQAGDTARASQIRESLKQQTRGPDLSNLNRMSRTVDTPVSQSPRPTAPTPPQTREAPRPSSVDNRPATARSAGVVDAPLRSPAQVALAEPPRPMPRISSLMTRLPPAIPQAVKPSALGGGLNAAVSLPLRLLSGQSPGQAVVGSGGTGLGAFAGGVVGAVGGPVGSFVGGAIGGFIGGAIADGIYNLAAPPGEKADGVPQPQIMGVPPFKGGQQPDVFYTVFYHRIDYRDDGSVNVDSHGSFHNVKGPIQGVRKSLFDPAATTNYVRNEIIAANGVFLISGNVLPSSIAVIERIVRADGQPDTGGNPPALPLPTDNRSLSTRSHPLAQPVTQPNGQAVVTTEAAAVPGGSKSYEGSSPRGDSPTWVSHAGLKGTPNPSTVPQNLGHDIPELQPQPGVPLANIPAYAEPEPPPLDISPFLPPDSKTDSPLEAPSTEAQSTYKDPRYQTLENLEQVKANATRPIQEAIDYWQRVGGPDNPAIKALEEMKSNVEKPYNKLIADFQRSQNPSAERITFYPGSTGLPAEAENKLIQLGDTGSLASTLNALDPRFNTIRQIEEAAGKSVSSIDEAIKVWDRKLGVNNPTSQQLQQQRQAILEPFERQVSEITKNLTSQDLDTYEKAKRYLEARYRQPPLPNLTQQAREKNQAVPNPIANASGKTTQDTNPLTDALAKLIPLLPLLVRPAITPTAGRLTRPDVQPTAPNYNNPGSTCDFDPCLAGLQRQSQGNSDKLDRLNAGLGAANLGAQALNFNEIIKRLDKIDNKLGPQIPKGGIGGFLTNMFKGIDRVADFLQIDRMLNALTFITVLHNAYFLSSGLTQTLFSMISNSLAVFGIKDSEGSPLEINRIVGQAFDAWAKSLLGVETVDGIKKAWAKYSRIYQAATNLLFSLTSILWGIQEVLEIIGENVNRIGNALKKWGVVGERAYKWMNEKMSKVGKMGKFDRVIQGIGSATEVTDNLSEISENVLDSQELIAGLGTQKAELEKAVKDNTPKEQIQNLPLEDKASKAILASISPPIDPVDEIKPES